MAGMVEPSVSSDLAVADMIANLKGLPNAKDFAAEFHMFQSDDVSE